VSHNVCRIPVIEMDTLINCTVLMSKKENTSTDFIRDQLFDKSVTPDVKPAV
jgi:hypothetical protein